MNFVEQLEQDQQFGFQVMRASGIRTLGVMPTEGLHVSVMAWFSKGFQVGPVMAYLGHEHDVRLIWPYSIREPRIYQATLRKALPVFKKTKHSGHIALKCLIGAQDQKAYGLRWQTTLTKEIIKVSTALIKPDFIEWLGWVSSGCEGDWILDEFNYKYAGTVVDVLTEGQEQLLSYKALGYELPFNLDGRLVLAQLGRP